MATTKGVTVLFNDVALVAAAGDQTSAAADLADGYSATASVKLTNGATGPTVAAQVQIQTSPDNSNWYAFGGSLVGSTVNSAVVSWGGIEIPMGVKYVRGVAGSNTGQNVTVRMEITEVSAVS